jgi:hypothetical protein
LLLQPSLANFRSPQKQDWISKSKIGPAKASLDQVKQAWTSKSKAWTSKSKLGPAKASLDQVKQAWTSKRKAWTSKGKH